MWIIPKSLHTLASVADTEALISDLNELSELSEQSLIARSNLLSARTWLRKWKRDTSMSLLSGRILKPSLGDTFEIEWTSCQEASLVSRLAPQGEDQEMKTLDTCGPTLSEESESLDDLPLFSSRMWTESSPQLSKEQSGQTPQGHQFCTMSLEKWKEWVIEQRQEYSQRQKSVPPINASAFLYLVYETALIEKPSMVCQTSSQEGLSGEPWRTPTTNDVGRETGLFTKSGEPWTGEGRAYREDGTFKQMTLQYQVEVISQNSPKSNEDSLPPRSPEALLKRKGSGGLHDPNLEEVVYARGQEIKKWPTPTAQEVPHYDMELNANGRRVAKTEGGTCHSVNLWDAARTSAGTHGEKWATPNTMDCLPPRTPEALKKHLTEGARAGRTSSGNLREQVCDYPWDVLKTHGHQEEEQVNTHGNPLASQDEDKMWRTPTMMEVKRGTYKSLEKLCSVEQGHQVSLTAQVQEGKWATPSQGDGIRLGCETTDQWKARAEKKKEQGINLHRPLNIETLLDAESQNPPIAGQLNPRWVETLMGLPIGWVMPSCLSPVTIATTSSECSETESSPQPQSEPSESYGSAWATPKAGACGMTARTSGRPIEKSTHLTTQVNLEAQRAWLTPVVGDAHLSLTKPISKYEGADRVNTPLRQVSEEHDYSGQLNPRWVETLRGLPMGWVMPSSRLIVIVLQRNEKPEVVEAAPIKPKKSSAKKVKADLDNGFMGLFEED